MSRLLSSQYNNHGHKTHFCRMCYHGFTTAELLNNHIENGCVAMEGSQIVLPKEGETMEFENYNNKFYHPVVISADLEAILKAINDLNKTQKAYSKQLWIFIYYQVFHLIHLNITAMLEKAQLINLLNNF